MYVFLIEVLAIKSTPSYDQQPKNFYVDYLVIKDSPAFEGLPSRSLIEWFHELPLYPYHHKESIDHLSGE
jgi:hypothetical protein